jgi:hypothetical protein
MSEVLDWTALPGWRWMPGMTDTDGRRVLRHYPVNGFLGTPDTSDPATIGAILALVREAWGDPYACVECFPQEPDETVWIVGVRDVRTLRHFDGPTEAHALYAALAATSKVTP